MIRVSSGGKTYSSGCTLEHGHLASGRGKGLSGDDGLENLGGDVP